jgi:hypothetical protein
MHDGPERFSRSRAVVQELFWESPFRDGRLFDGACQRQFVAGNSWLAIRGRQFVAGSS